MKQQQWPDWQACFLYFCKFAFYVSFCRSIFIFLHIANLLLIESSHFLLQMHLQVKLWSNYRQYNWKCLLHEDSQAIQRDLASRRMWKLKPYSLHRIFLHPLSFSSTLKSRHFLYQRYVFLSILSLSVCMLYTCVVHWFRAVESACLHWNTEV